MKENIKNFFFVLLSLFITLLIVNGLFFVMPTIKKLGNSLAPVRTISVSAEGKTVVTPDIAKINFSVVTEGKEK